MATVPVVTPALGGAALTATNATAGPDTLNPSGRPVILFINNGSGSAITVSVVTPGNTKWAQPEPDVTSASIGAGLHGVIRLPAELADPTTGLIGFTASSATSVTFYAVGAS
jgi:hypothetical protein